MRLAKKGRRLPAVSEAMMARGAAGGGPEPGSGRFRAFLFATLSEVCECASGHHIACVKRIPFIPAGQEPDLSRASGCFACREPKKDADRARGPPAGVDAHCRRAASRFPLLSDGIHLKGHSDDYDVRSDK